MFSRPSETWGKQILLVHSPCSGAGKCSRRANGKVQIELQPKGVKLAESTAEEAINNPVLKYELTEIVQIYSEQCQ